jgi:hypothetical protein
MMQNIFVGIIAAIAIGAGIWAWWFDNGNTRKNISEKESDQES